jgi:hypothetical protein
MHGRRRSTRKDAAMSQLILKRASASRSSGQWSDDDYDVLENGKVVGRIFLSPAAPQDRQWMWTLAYDYHEDPHQRMDMSQREKRRRPRSQRAG